MSKLNTLLKTMLHNPSDLPKLIMDKLYKTGILNILPDSLYLRLYYRAVMKKKLDLNNPKTFNEKLQWLKLNDRKPEYSIYVDKYAVRSFIAKTIGEKYLIPLIGVYDSVAEIDWEDLPRQFALKCTHGSGSNIICLDKEKFNIKHAENMLKKWMSKSFYWYGREWPYKNVRPRIICEELVLNENKIPNDYKVLCFNGKAKIIQVHIDRFGDHRLDFYDVAWNKTGISSGHNTSDFVYEKPLQLEEMVRLSEKLGAGICHIRIDWYIANDKLYFGEMTLYDGSGFEPFDNEKDDYLLGSLIQLPINNK